jgi:hypothetical protein
VRHFQRLKRRLSAEGVGGLVHQGRRQPAPRRALALRQQVSQFIPTTYPPSTTAWQYSRFPSRSDMWTDRVLTF